MAWCHRTMLAYWKFESISLQRRVFANLTRSIRSPKILPSELRAASVNRVYVARAVSWRGLPGGWQPGEGEGGSGLRSLMPSFPYSPIYAHSSAHRMPRARICSLEYRDSAQWGAAATKSRRGRRGPSAAERSPAA